jgi:hypothetical protein
VQSSWLAHAPGSLNYERLVIVVDEIWIARRFTGYDRRIVSPYRSPRSRQQRLRGCECQELRAHDGLGGAVVFCTL